MEAQIDLTPLDHVSCLDAVDVIMNSGLRGIILLFSLQRYQMLESPHTLTQSHTRR